MNEELLPKFILTPAAYNHLEQSWYDHRRSIWKANEELSIGDLLTDNVPSAPPSADIPDKDTLDHEQSDLIWTSGTTKTMDYSDIVGVDNTGAKEYGKAAGLYNAH